MKARTAATLVIVSILAMGVAIVTSPSGRGTTPGPLAAASFTLYGSASEGWGFAPTSVTSPGPTITVDQLDEVSLRLEGVDSPRHNFYVDYNGNDAPDPPGEPVSPDFRNSSGPITYAFVADVAGSFTYYCEYHQSTMRGTFVVRTQNARPAATISMPDGTGDWTGGSVHRIWWNMSDPEDANTALTVFLNYTSGAGSGSIVGPLPGTANPNRFDWTVPAIDAADVVVNLTVIDVGGLKAWDEASVPVVDSTAPQIVATVPAPDAVDVPRTATILIMWSESMDLTATGSSTAFGLRVSPSGPWVPGTFSWNSPQHTILTFTPASSLQADTTYDGVVNTSARDDSGPGNALASAYTWSFTTGTATDTLPPQISSVSASPPVQDVGRAVNVSAVVTDNVGIAGVWLNVTSPSGGTTNESMRPGAGSTYYLERTYPEVGVHTVRIWAVDTSGLRSSTLGTFEIRDVAAPTIDHTPPEFLGLGEPLNVTATVTDDGVVGLVELNWTDTSGRVTNASMFSLGSLYWLEIPMQLRTGTLRYFLWAVDDVGNEAMTALAGVSVQAPSDAIVLYGHTTQGWGLGPDNLTSPGPVLRTASGATVKLLLIPVDGIRHNFFVDYNADRIPSPDEPLSPDFSDQAITFTFVAGQEGVFTYYCEYHPGAMRGNLEVGQPGSLEPFPLWTAGVIILAAFGTLAAILLWRRRKSMPPKP